MNFKFCLNFKAGFEVIWSKSYNIYLYSESSNLSHILSQNTYFIILYFVQDD